MVTFIPTPIGNLEDITLRTLRVLQSCKVLLCEDTRVTKKLIALLKEQNLLKDALTYQYFSFHSHNQLVFLQNTPLEFFDQNIAFLCDAGMPCISDPGVELVKFLQQNSIPYDVLGGVSALTLGVAFSGLVQKEFSFLGFPPHKKKEKMEFFSKVLKSLYPLVFYESPHRLLETLEILYTINPYLEVFLGKELSKKYQDIFCGRIQEIYKSFQTKTIKGEWVMVIKPNMSEDTKHLTQEEVYSLDIPPKIKAKILAKMTNKSIKEIYGNLWRETL
ncbi:16S rRNA (cytidine(1402)-2'-O)-methyltransferase [Helicobacter apodemus]|uniref:16S rRNA (Cytidine(1402)-2'-O)-methyltransferase n=1 Tax=Helicobacter apodemus TaxID=135569 RepID=A0A2U8FFE6_9HELI|nr:16S rRNA (cytidine(1402)-2'-O)-methyltransferase [Helicobacter apodemus]AWI34883.1 16S rRNA (cytidine(1402)-2'-O)-methyltransferase [Helicobacter apodemus]